MTIESNVAELVEQAYLAGLKEGRQESNDIIDSLGKRTYGYAWNMNKNVFLDKIKESIKRAEK